MMELSRHVEDDSSSDERDPIRHMSDNSGSTARRREAFSKNVVLLLDSDVQKKDGKVYMPNNKEMQRLKKPKHGQFKEDVKFTKTMTEKHVEEELRRHFPILRNYGRLSCATAADKRTRLEFHNSSRSLWNGTKINRRIRGNSALYVLCEVTPESGCSSLQQLPPMPETMGKLQRLKRKPNSSSSSAPEVVPNRGKQVLEGSSCLKGSKEGEQQSCQEQGDHSGNPTTSLLCNSGTSQQTQNPKIGLNSSSGEDHAKESQVKKVRRYAESKNSSESGFESTVEDASGVDDNTEHSTGKTEEAASRSMGMERYLQNSSMDPSEGSSLEEIFPQRIATDDQGSLSDREVNEIYQDVLGISIFEPVIIRLCPKEGPITGGTEFLICLNVNGMPENVASLRALFKGVGFADLTPVIEGVYAGRSPASEILGKVAVTVGSPDGTWNSLDETEFEYHPNVTQELQKLISKMPDTKRNIPLDYQTLNPSLSAGTVCSPSSSLSVVDRPLMADESMDIWSLKALQCILFAAAATNDRECIEIIFSTSAGEAVFQTYRNSSILLEDTARARGHQNLAEYLQNVHKRLSEEIVCDVQTVTIDWVELKRASAKKDICSGTDESQALEPDSFLESDDDQSSYFADDETSICQSPSASEFSNEDECIESKYMQADGGIRNPVYDTSMMGMISLQDDVAVSGVTSSGKSSFIAALGRELENREAVRQTAWSTDKNLRNLLDNVESKTIAVVGVISPQDNVGALTATTNITFYDSNLQPRSVSLRHQKSAKVKLTVEKCENVVVGDRAEVNICCDKDLFNQNNRSKSTSSRSNESDSLLQADGGIRNPVCSSGKQRRKRSSQKKSGKNHALKKNSSRKMEAEWQFPLRLSDFTDNERQEKDIDQWLKQLIPSVLPKIQDLDDIESVIEPMEEDGRRLRESSIPNCIEKLDCVIRRALMMSLMEEEDKKKYQTLKIELQFALAEFYIKEDYLKALNCLRALERDLTLREGFESQKGRLYAKIAKVMELCLEFSKDLTSVENELEITPETQLTDQNPDDVVLSYFQRALESSNNEALLQISCYLGKASVLLKCCKGKNENRNLTQVRENLRSVEILFNRISPALKCQFYLAEAFLLYYEGRFKMAKDKLDTLMAREIMIDTEEHLTKRLERECLGSKRFRFLTEELEKALAETISGAETGFEQIDFLKDLDQIQGHL